MPFKRSLREWPGKPTAATLKSGIASHAKSMTIMWQTHIISTRRGPFQTEDHREHKQHVAHKETVAATTSKWAKENVVYPKEEILLKHAC